MAYATLRLSPGLTDGYFSVRETRELNGNGRIITEIKLVGPSEYRQQRLNCTPVVRLPIRADSAKKRDDRRDRISYHSAIQRDLLVWHQMRAGERPAGTPTRHFCGRRSSP